MHGGAVDLRLRDDLLAAPAPLVGAPHAPVVLRWFRFRRTIQKFTGEFGPELTLEDCEKGGKTKAHIHPLVNRVVQDKTDNKITGRITKHPVNANYVEVEWDCDKETQASMPRHLSFADALHSPVEESGVQGITAAQKTDGIFCQDELNKKYGHLVTVFERAPLPGRLLRRREVHLGPRAGR